MKRPRLLYTPRSFEIFEYGGVNRYFYEMLAAGPIGEHFSVTLFAGLHLCRFPLQNLQSCEVRYLGARLPRVRGIGRILRAANFIMERLFVPDFDIVHETFYSKHPFRKGGALFVTTVHDMIGELFPEAMLDRRQEEWKARSIKTADGIVFVSESTRRDCVRLVPEAADVPGKVIHHGVNTIPTGGRSLHPRPYILYVGEREGYKNFELLHKVYTASPEISGRCDLVCFGGREFGGREPGVFRYQGGDEVLAALYHNAVCLAYPSAYEGFGLPPLEALAYGCPVVASDASSIPEIVGPVAKLVPPGDVQALARALIETLSAPLSKADRSRLAVHAAGFSWERSARMTSEFYFELLEKNGRKF